MMTHDEMIDVIMHHKNGGEVEVSIRGKQKWEACLRPIWDFDGFDYRAKPEPVILWLELDSRGLVIASYKNQTIAQYKGTIKKFIEAP
jgi:hypothetical protein